jgi:hypothetical protein
MTKNAQMKDHGTGATTSHQLLSLGHDVTDLMGARNLHIASAAGGAVLFQPSTHKPAISY